MRSNSSTVLLTQKALLKPLEAGWGDVSHPFVRLKFMYLMKK